jgi:hypothetical protein
MSDARRASEHPAPAWHIEVLEELSEKLDTVRSEILIAPTPDTGVLSSGTLHPRALSLEETEPFRVVE